VVRHTDRGQLRSELLRVLRPETAVLDPGNPHTPRIVP
jgi:hypothetical protein